MILSAKKSQSDIKWIRKSHTIKDIDSAKKLISFYEKIADSLSKKVNERQSEIADLWLTIKSIQAICELHKESGIDCNTLKQIIFMTQRH